MRKICKVILNMFLVTIMVTFFIPFDVQAADKSGTCGANLNWELSDGVLTISGTGAMTDYWYPVYIEYGVYEANTPWYDDRTDIREIIVKDGVTSIGNNAFLQCSEVISIKLPESLLSIRESAFYNCVNLTEITLPEKTASIGDYAFSGCISLKEIEIPESIERIGIDAFRSCRSLKSIILPEKITSVENGTFSYCTNLEEVILSESVTSIGNGAFNCCKNLSSISLPENLESIGGSAFSDCDSLKNVILPKGVTTLGFNTFSNCVKLESVEIPDSMEEIDRYVFQSCDNLTDIYYYGSEEEWSSVKIEIGNDSLQSVNMHYYVQPMSFEDVTESGWYYNSVRYVFTKEIMNGVSENAFNPGTTTTRAMVVTMLYRLNGEPEVEMTDAFRDVPKDQWYSKAVAWALEEGITNGTKDGTIFLPDKAISRQEMVTMLYRYESVGKYKVSVDLEREYPDANEISSWAREAFEWAVEEEIILGKAENSEITLSPNDEMTRAEAATIFMRISREKTGALLPFFLC